MPSTPLGHQVVPPGRSARGGRTVAEDGHDFASNNRPGGVSHDDPAGPSGPAYLCPTGAGGAQDYYDGAESIFYSGCIGSGIFEQEGLCDETHAQVLDKGHERWSIHTSSLAGAGYGQVPDP